MNDHFRDASPYPPERPKAEQTLVFQKIMVDEQASSQTRETVEVINTSIDILPVLYDAVSVDIIFTPDDPRLDTKLAAFDEHQQRIRALHNAARTFVEYDHRVKSLTEPDTIINYYERTMARLTGDWWTVEEHNGGYDILYMGTDTDTYTDLTPEAFKDFLLQSIQKKKDAVLESTRAVTNIVNDVPLTTLLPDELGKNVRIPSVLASDEDVENKLATLQSMYHDLGLPLTAFERIKYINRIKGTPFEEDIPQILQSINSALVASKENFQTASVLLKEGYIKLRTTTTQIQSAFNSAMVRLREQGIECSLVGFEEEDTVLWSVNHALMLANNIAENTVSAYHDRDQSRMNEPKTLTVRLVNDPTSDTLQIITEDKGNGFIEDIERYGYGENRGGWNDTSIKSTRVGMGRHAEILKTKYNASITPENVREIADRVVGGRNVITLQKAK